MGLHCSSNHQMVNALPQRPHRLMWLLSLRRKCTFSHWRSAPVNLCPWHHPFLLSQGHHFIRSRSALHLALLTWSSLVHCYKAFTLQPTVIHFPSLTPSKPYFVKVTSDLHEITKSSGCFSCVNLLEGSATSDGDVCSYLKTYTHTLLCSMTPYSSDLLPVSLAAPS